MLSDEWKTNFFNKLREMNISPVLVKEYSNFIENFEKKPCIDTLYILFEQGILDSKEYKLLKEIYSPNHL